MTRSHISFDQLTLHPRKIWKLQGMLLTCGDWQTRKFNTMTVGWGSLGVMWNLPFAQVVIRPTRYTYEFMERYDTFTLTDFAPKYADALDLLGNTSGRDGDKIAVSGLTPIASSVVAAPGFEEASLILECRKIYWDDMKNDHFLDPSIEERYPGKDYHRIYYGEILAVLGEEKYRA